jgi:hypothetical protein
MIPRRKAPCATEVKASASSRIINLNPELKNQDQQFELLLVT